MFRMTTITYLAALLRNEGYFDHLLFKFNSFHKLTTIYFNYNLYIQVLIISMSTVAKVQKEVDFAVSDSML